jgi:hypothetical protein
MKTIGIIIIISMLVGVALADQYLHVPRGSNNRLNEQSANRNNGNRLFDSQNNNKGGYNVGDATTAAFTTEAQQAPMVFFEGSTLHLEWTNQHACGDNPKVRCEHIFQYYCEDGIRNGLNTNTPPENADDTSTGLHEPRAFYAACKNDIQRNKGLFLADQDLNGDTAIYTRQNPNGNRRGYECPEERDYYPWWHDSPWRDVAILTSNTTRCKWYREALEGLGRPFTKKEVKCEEAVWSRDNHLGNTLDGQMASWSWKLPSTETACNKNSGDCKCVFRSRYNISTTDYDWFADASLNGELSPVQQNPTVGIGVMQGFKLAINTAQTGRTFQDRSHVFYIRSRDNVVSRSAEIHNVIVRGKRGNIVQTYPAIEYDFTPNHLNIGTDEFVQFQWTGSNTHNNGPNAGDGQAGDDGQGTGGTDRSNVVELRKLGENYPRYLPEEDNKSMWHAVTESIPAMTPRQLAMDFATSGRGPDVDTLLNNANPYFLGPLLRFREGTYHYMCTRNNNFSNRSQKATLHVGDDDE